MDLVGFSLSVVSPIIPSAMLKVKIISSMNDVDPAGWDALVRDGSPFIEWDWLACLEESGCVSSEAGWMPQHLVVYDDGKLIAACPMYVKGHSMGEFVFDHSWADAAYRAGISYYPKLLISVPFTPATGTRFLTARNYHRTALIKLLGHTLKDICADHQLSSVHVNFCLEDEAQALEQIGYLRRIGIQYHWQNLGYNSFDAYLAQFRSKRRNQIKRELREMNEQGLEIRTLVGEEIPDELFPIMFRLYQATIDKLYWGRQYLRQKFFRLLASRFKHNLCFVIARHGGEIISGTFNVQKSGVFYGRYWGAIKELRYMHFNVCYYAAIEHCIKHGMVRFEPGAGGDFKRLRGFNPQPTLSMHYFADARLADGVARYLKSERQQIRRAIDWLQDESELKPSSKQQ